MKKLNLLRLLFGAMFLIAATAFTSCVDDNDDDGMPYLEVAPEALTFSAEGVAEGASAVTVKSNRPWTLAFESVADWVTPSATEPYGNAEFPAQELLRRLFHQDGYH